MKINHENIFVADIYKAENLKGHSNDFEYPTFTPVLKRKNIVVIKFKDFYVPVYYMDKLVNRLSIKLAILTGKYVNDKRFLSTDPACATFQEFLYIDNLEPASELCVKERISLNTARNIQTLYTHMANAGRKEQFIVNPADL